MKPDLAPIEKFRITTGPLASDASYGRNGAFDIPVLVGWRRKLCRLAVIVSGGLGWEHVSVSIPGQPRCPTWDEMCAVKDLFWDPEETVVQFHPPKSQYVNCHPYTLHLWRPTEVELPLPLSEMVGPRS